MSELNSNCPITHLNGGDHFFYDGEEYVFKGRMSVAAECIQANRIKDNQAFVFDHRHLVELSNDHVSKKAE